MDRKRTHLENIQAIIVRMAVGSFLLKSWSVLIAAGLLAVTANPAHARFGWLALFMAIVFWLIDAFVLRQQRLYRKTYERVQNMSESEIDFSLDTTPVDSEADSFRSVLFFRTLCIPHGAVILAIVVVRAILYYG